MRSEPGVGLPCFLRFILISGSKDPPSPSQGTDVYLSSQDTDSLLCYCQSLKLKFHIDEFKAHPICRLWFFFSFFFSSRETCIIIHNIIVKLPPSFIKSIWFFLSSITSFITTKATAVLNCCHVSFKVSKGSLFFFQYHGQSGQRYAWCNTPWRLQLYSDPKAKDSYCVPDRET